MAPVESVQANKNMNPIQEKFSHIKDCVIDGACRGFILGVIPLVFFVYTLFSGPPIPLSAEVFTLFAVLILPPFAGIIIGALYGLIDGVVTTKAE